MTIVEKSAPLELLGLHEGDALVGFSINKGRIIFQVAVTNPSPARSKRGSAGAWARHARGSSRLAVGETHDEARMAYYREKFDLR